MDLPRLSTQRRALLAKATEEYAAALVGSPAEEYLTGRGVPVEVAQRFRLGYVAEPVDGHEDRFRGKLSIPYLTPTGPVGMRFRKLEAKPEKMKFDQEANQRTPFYNVLDLHKSEPWIAVCEGEPDTWVTSGIVGVPAVGIPGVDHWNLNKMIWSRLLQDYDTVFLLMDPDKAGQGIIPELMRLVENPVKINLPADVNDTVNEYGAAWLLEKMGLN